MLPAKRLSAWVAALAGLCVLALAARSGVLALVLAAAPGALMLAGGVRALLQPDVRAPQYIATGAVLGLLLALPLGFADGSGLGIAMLALSCLAFVAGGWLQISLQPLFEGIPAPAPSPAYSAMVAMDDAMLNIVNAMSARPGPASLREAARESIAAHALFAERGWLDDPASFHRPPPAIGPVHTERLRVKGFDCELLRFESGFEPEAGLPGRERWLGYRENLTARVLLLRHKKPGPWLVCVHGFGMGDPARDFGAFRARQLHEAAGLNVALFVLPVHGARAPGRVSGEKFFSTSPLDFVHAESQAVWDLRRLIGWIRTQEATQLGLYGISLGAYTSAVLAGLEDGLACVIAGVPPSDVIATSEHLEAGADRRIAVAAGVDYRRDRELQRVVSPLALVLKIERDRRFIFAATGDQFVPVEQIRALWLHWEQPRIGWCTGGHLSALLQKAPRDLVDEALAATLLASPAR